MSDSTLIFSKSLIKAISLSFLCPVPACPQLFTVRDQTTLCTRSRFLPATLTGSWVALHLLSCHQDTSWLFISLFSHFGVVWGFFLLQKEKRRPLLQKTTPHGCRRGSQESGALSSILLDSFSLSTWWWCH